MIAHPGQPSPIPTANATAHRDTSFRAFVVIPPVEGGRAVLLPFISARHQPERRSSADGSRPMANVQHGSRGNQDQRGEVEHGRVHK